MDSDDDNECDDNKEEQDDKEEETLLQLAPCSPPGRLLARLHMAGRQTDRIRIIYSLKQNLIIIIYLI